MPSFSKMGIFPVGYFRGITTWLLRERRDVTARIDTLEAELVRIGEVKISYRPLPEGEGVKRSHQATGFAVTKGSSVARLMQAYIATGGNPYDISGFLHPDTTTWVDTDSGAVMMEQYPGGGMIAPKSAEYVTKSEPTSEDGSTPPEKTGFEAYQGGMIDHPGYVAGRMGGRLDRGTWDSDTVNLVMHDVRKWANKEIKARLQDMEWRIVKLADLAEQLRQERDFILMDAFAGQLNGLGLLDEVKQDPRRLCQCIIQDMYALLYETDATGVPYGFRANVETGFLRFVYPDEPADQDRS